MYNTVCSDIPLCILLYILKYKHNICIYTNIYIYIYIYYCITYILLYNIYNYVNSYVFTCKLIYIHKYIYTCIHVYVLENNPYIRLFI